MSTEYLVMTGFFTSLMLVGISGAGALMLGATLGLDHYKKASYCFAVGNLFTTVLTPIFLLFANGSAFNIALCLTLSNFFAITGLYLNLYGLSKRCKRPVNTPLVVTHIVIYSLINASLSHENLIGLMDNERVIFITFNAIFISLAMFSYVKLNPDRRTSIGEKVLLGALILGFFFLIYYPFSRLYNDGSILKYLTYRIPIQVLHVHTWTVGLIVLMLSDLINIYRKQALIDGMTGLYNRRYFINYVTKAIERSTNHSLILCDIDFFKTINDTYGHSTGDDVIVAFSKTLTSIIGNEYVTARFGGEEFAIYLQNTSLEKAQDLAHQIKEATQNLEIQTLEETVKFTVSFGVTQLTDKKTLSTALQEADKALYTAKHAGRNQVSVF